MAEKPSMPWWIQAISYVGVPTVIAFYLLGIVPGVRSPFDQINDSIKAAAAVLERHDQSTRETQRLLKLICAGQWKGDEVMRRACWSNGHVP